MSDIFAAIKVNTGQSFSRTHAPDDPTRASFQLIVRDATEGFQVRLIFWKTEGGVESVVAQHTAGANGTSIKQIEVPPASLRIDVLCLAGSGVISLSEVFEAEQLGQVSAESMETKGVSSAFQEVTVVGATTTIDLSLGYNIALSLEANTTLVLLNPEDGERYFFWIDQTDDFTLAWPANVFFMGSDTAPVITATADAIDSIILMYRENVDKYLANAGQNFGGI